VKVSYTIADPTGNITALVTSAVSTKDRAAVVRALLTGYVEQVGFVVPPQCGGTARLEMMGGEFCGNATMSLAAVLCRSQGDASVHLPLEVSGASSLVSCTAEHVEGALYRGCVEMPLPQHIEQRCLPGLDHAVPIVFFQGIAHVILPGGQAVPEERVAAWCSLLRTDALGVLPFWNGPCKIDPVVWVPAAESLVHEHGCGSGSAALGAWFAQMGSEPVELHVQQPGGTIVVHASKERITISGLVRLESEVQSVVV
jgi:diaminopimelate epimerase